MVVGTGIHAKEDHVFKRKKKKVEVPTIDTRTIEVPTAQGIKDMIVPAVAAAKDQATDVANQAESWAKPYVEQGLDFAKQQSEQGRKSAEKAKSDLAKKGKDLEKSAPKLADLKAGGKDAAKRSRDAALVLRGEATAVPVKKKGGFGKAVLNLGLLAAIGAVVAVAWQKFQQPKDDPWARPLTDPYVAPATGRDATVAAGEGATIEKVDAGAEGTTGGQVSEGTEAAADGEIVPPQGQVPVEGDPSAPRN